MVDATAVSFAPGRSRCPANPVGLLGDCSHSEKDREEGFALSTDLEVTLKFVEVGRLKLHQAKEFSKMRFWGGLFTFNTKIIGACWSQCFLF